MEWKVFGKSSCSGVVEDVLRLGRPASASLSFATGVSDDTIFRGRRFVPRRKWHRVHSLFSFLRVHAVAFIASIAASSMFDSALTVVAVTLMHKYGVPISFGEW